jgi:hypothetical protein
VLLDKGPTNKAIPALTLTVHSFGVSSLSSPVRYRTKDFVFRDDCGKTMPLAFVLRRSLEHLLDALYSAS